MLLDLMRKLTSSDDLMFFNDDPPNSNNSDHMARRDSRRRIAIGAMDEIEQSGTYAMDATYD